MNTRQKHELDQLLARLIEADEDIAFEAVCQWLKEKDRNPTLVLDRLRELEGDDDET